MCLGRVQAGTLFPSNPPHVLSQGHVGRTVTLMLHYALEVFHQALGGGVADFKIMSQCLL